MNQIKSKIIYKIKSFSPEQKKYFENLKNDKIHPLMAQIYALRGVKDFNDINLIQKLEPFKNLKNIQLAAEILCEAILKKEKICIVADYDVDGATACAIGVRGIRLFGGNIDFVVPDRFIHGYGLTPSVVDEAIKKKNPDLIVTVDNGIASNEGIAYAKKKGLKVLVTDHHLAGEVLPEADCIVNPNQPGCEFKSKSLAGCGVMFYVLAALRDYMIKIKIYDEKTAPNIFLLLDLVAVGTVADVVKLDLNNRIMVKLGLNLIRKGNTRPGILSLIEIAKRNYQQLSTSDIAFGIAPRINAAGRLEDMTIGINCLLTDKVETANKLATELNKINKTRKEIESDMKEIAIDMSLSDVVKHSCVIFDESFHEGVVGIVSSRIKDATYKPTIVFAISSEDENLLKGSGRSIADIHLRDALDYVYKKNPGLIVKFGGHAMAAGLTIKKTDFKFFGEQFDLAVEKLSDGKEIKNIKEIDLELPTNLITLDSADQIKNEIWGQGFQQPLFCGKFRVVEQKVIKDAHLKLKIEKDGEFFDAMWFFTNQLIEKEEEDFVYTLGINEFLGNIKLQIYIEDIRRFNDD